MIFSCQGENKDKTIHFHRKTFCGMKERDGKYYPIIGYYDKVKKPWHLMHTKQLDMEDYLCFMSSYIYMPQISMEVFDRGHKTYSYFIHAKNDEIQPSNYSNVAFLPPLGSDDSIKDYLPWGQMDPDMKAYSIDCSQVSIGTLNFDNACHPCKLKGDITFMCGRTGILGILACK